MQIFLIILIVIRLKNISLHREFDLLTFKLEIYYVMSKYVYLKKSERDEFLSILYCAQNFKRMVSERYFRNSFGLPARIRLLFWCCDTVLDIISSYVGICNELYGKSLHRRVY